MYKKKLHREEQINKNYLPIFEKKIKALKYLHQTRLWMHAWCFTLWSSKFFFQMKNLSSKIVDYNDGKETECAFEFCKINKPGVKSCWECVRTYSE